jgi:hypothetical protein
MSEQQSKQTETEETARVDRLLGLLGELSTQDAPPALRERLSMIASQRVAQISGQAGVRSAGRGRVMWFKPTFAALCLAAATLATGLLMYFFLRGPEYGGGTAKVISPAISPETRVHELPPTRPPVARLKIHHPHPAFAQSASTRQMTMRLPYSNSAIETGNDATIRVSMSQSELLSLGFPINTTVQDRRIVAELTLGDDGLPRAISLPMPLEVIPLEMNKEKK